MWEILKLGWDFVVLRDGVRKGQLGWRKAVFAVGFVLLEYAIALPAVLFYDKHPQYKPLFMAAIGADGVLFVVFMWVAIRWYLQGRAEADALTGHAPKNVP